MLQQKSIITYHTRDIIKKTSMTDCHQWWQILWIRVAKLVPKMAGSGRCCYSQTPWRWWGQRGQSPSHCN